MKNLSTHYICLSVFIMALVSCSGGSLDSDTDTIKPKVIVNTGSNRSVDESSVVTLNASAVGQTSPLTYQWSVSPNITITQAETTQASATFIAPSTTQPLTYVFTLEVTDADGNKGSDSVEYQILPVNEAPVALASVQQVDGVNVNALPAGIEVVLDGSKSYDADAIDGQQTILQFKWQQTAGEAVLKGISTDGDSLAFLSPILEEDNTLDFSLTVTDEEGLQDTVSISLNILSASHTVPVVDAGNDHQVFAGETIILTGKANTSVASAKPLTYYWLNDSELNPSIKNAFQLSTFAIAPKVTKPEKITFTLAVTDASGNVVEDVINVVVHPLLIRPLNDSGILFQATNKTNTTEYQGDFPGQDGQRGQDVIEANNVLEKAGRGEAGFDFTRLDNKGDEVDESVATWSCVRDNVTGLIWEVKTTPSALDLHSSAYTYSWFLTELEGDPSGNQLGRNASCSLTECNTSAYVQAVNAQGLCNFNDWRMPSHQELLSLVNFGRVEGPMIDANYFPNTSNSANLSLWYWTNQSSADGAGGEISRTAWAVDFKNGNDNFLTKSTAAYIRLVRAGR